MTGQGGLKPELTERPVITRVVATMVELVMVPDTPHDGVPVGQTPSKGSELSADG